MSTYRIGLDIGGTKIHGIAVDDSTDPASVLGEVRAPTPCGPDAVVAAASDVVARLRATLPPAVRLRAVGVGVPGAVDHDGVLTNAFNLGIVAPLPLRAALSDTIKVPVTVDNDLDAAARGAASWIRDQGLDEDVALLLIGTGLAAGFVLDGHTRRGASGVVGEIGHLPVDPDGPRCSCGQRGCLEVFVSGSGLARQWPYDGPQPQPVALFDAADAGESVARAVRDLFVRRLADAVRIVTLTVDPAHVVLGGGVMMLGDRVVKPLLDALDAEEASSPFVADLRMRERILVLPTDYPAAALGAAELARTSEGATPWKS